jgi:hypothetical protein
MIRSADPDSTNGTLYFVTGTPVPVIWQGEPRYTPAITNIWWHHCCVFPPPAICPICQGSGIRERQGIENAPINVATGAVTPCHGCEGRGWVR